MWFQLAKVRVTTFAIQPHQQLAIVRGVDRRQESNPAGTATTDQRQAYGSKTIRGRVRVP
jgi:hypothetical protein